MKKNLERLGKVAFLTVFLSVFFMYDAKAYIDPAATSYIIQVVAAVVVTCGVGLSVFRKKIALFFREQKMKRLEKKLAKKGEEE